MTWTVRNARAQDAPAIVAMLNPIIAAGRYTVMEAPITVDEQRAFLLDLPARSVCHLVVEADRGPVLGLQDVLPASDEPALRHVGSISTFVALDARRTGIGSALWSATLPAARREGFAKIMATIRADNPEALAFYRHLGFEIIGTARRHARVGGGYVDEVLTERWSADG